MKEKYTKSEILQTLKFYQDEIKSAQDMLKKIKKKDTIYINRIMYAQIAINSICKEFNIPNKKVTFSEILQAKKGDLCE